MNGAFSVKSIPFALDWPMNYLSFIFFFKKIKFGAGEVCNVLILEKLVFYFGLTCRISGQFSSLLKIIHKMKLRSVLGSGEI